MSYDERENIHIHTVNCTVNQKMAEGSFRPSVMRRKEALLFIVVLRCRSRIIVKHFSILSIVFGIAFVERLVVTMIKKVTVCALLTVFLNLETSVPGFAPRASFARSSFALFAEEEKKEILTFNADLELISDPVPSERKDEFARFFARKDCRDLFLSAGGTRTLKELSMDDADLISLWKESCECRWGSSMLPEDGDIIVGVETAVRFPGLTLVTHTCSGVKTRTKEDGSLQYDMVLIGERNEPRGPAAIVWIFNQLTGNESKPKDKYLTPSAKALVKVSIIEKNASYAVKYHMDFQIDIEFPRVLLRILPTSKEKMEEQGSSSVRKTLTKDVLLALDAVCSKFQHNQSVPESILL